MAPLDDTTAATRFDSFHVYRTSYKKIGEHEIEVGILVPMDLKPGKHPLMVKFHGGGLVTGDCLYPDWIASFFIPFIHRTSSVVVLPNYRLIPESTGADILEDLNDFWTWFNKRSVDDFLTSKGHALDLDYRHILATGESAGGYMALMSALTQPQAKGSGGIKAVLAQYPMTNYLRCSPSETFMGRPSPKEPELDAHLSSIEPGTIISSAFPPARTDISDPLAAYNRYLDYFGHDKNLWPIGLVGETGKDGEGRQLPPTWIIHGDADTAVDVEDSKKFLEKCKSVIGKGVEVRLELREGMEHGFDIEMKEDEEKWLREGLKWVEGEWLS